MKRFKNIAEINTGKYPKAPTWNEIESFLTELEMNMYQFERFYGLPFNQLTQVKSGAKRLAPQYWHFVFERIKPAFGAAFLEEYTINKQKKHQKHFLPQNLPIPVLNTGNHDRIVTIK